MNFRQLGATGIAVSEIGFGTWGLGGDSYGPIGAGEAKAVLCEALDRGVTFFDTSDFYGAGQSETLLGEVMPAARDRIVIATKAGLLLHRGFEMRYDFSPAHIRRCLEGSLRRLRTDYVDVFLLHSPERVHMEQGEELIATLEAFKEEGKVRATGLSALSPLDARWAIERFPFDVAEVNFNLIDQRAEDDGFLGLAGERKVGVVVKTPLCFGYLGGHLDGDADFEGQDHRTNWPREQLARWARSPDLFSHLHEERGRTSAQLALLYCLSSDVVSTVIPGMMRTEEVRENVGTCDLAPLSGEELQEIGKIYDGNTFYDGKAKLKGRE